jgi:hypothetical protein
LTNQFKKNACYPSEAISKKAVIASFQEGTRTRQWLESLRDDQWFITTFIPETRTVCAIVYAGSGTSTNFSLTLPVVTSN